MPPTAVPPGERAHPAPGKAEPPGSALPDAARPPGADDGPRPALPHERDEAMGASPSDTAAEPDPVIAQAARDLAAGQVDTDLRATPGLDAARRDALAGRVRGEPGEPVG